MTTFHILAPLLLLILLGLVLAKVRFLGAAFMADLNKLAFWIALPALLFRSASHAETPGAQTVSLFLLLIGVTLATAAVGWLASIVLGLPAESHGTLAQSAFRGNLAYIGIPVLSYAFAGVEGGREAFATTVIVMTALMTFYNVFGVVVLQASLHRFSWSSLQGALRAIATNPLLIAGLSGLAFGLTQTKLPLFVDRTLEALGGAAVPIALLCIGGNLASIQLGERLKGIATAAVVKTFLAPALVGVAAPLLSLPVADLRIALVLAACPTAATAFVMVRQMGGDEPLASGSIVLSTILAGVSLPVVLWLTS